MRTGWILGWATPRVWFAPLVETVFPEDDHVYLDAASDTWDRLEGSGRFDCLAGYSLGSQLLLENPQCAARLTPRVVLLAPIFAFPREAGLGGKIARAQILYLAKWLRRDPSAALADFSVRAGLGLPSQSVNSADLARLDWGLKRLETGVVNPPAPRTWELYCGNGDNLLQLETLMKLDPAVRAVKGATHHPRELLNAWACARRETEMQTS